MHEITRGVVLGTSIAGMLAASALARHVDEVVVVERDEAPTGPFSRKGLPQSWHVHQLWSSGAKLIDKLLPGTINRLYQAGANRIGVPQQHITLTAFGWQHRFTESQYMVCCSRPLIDWTILQQIQAEPRITVLWEHDATGLLGTADHVTGVIVRDMATGAHREMQADLVVDATGRASQLANWLTGMGLPPVETDVVDSGITYATRLFRAPPGAGKGFPIVTVYADYRVPRPGQNGTIFPIENGNWLVTVSGTRGGEPPADDNAFTEFARCLRHPIVADFLAGAEPLTSVQRTRSTSNRRLHFDKLPQWPRGLAAIGDAVAAFNPIFGHGIIAAAMGATALSEALERVSSVGDVGALLVRKVARIVDEPWLIATSQDTCYPDCRIQAKDPRLTEKPDPRQQQLTDFVSEVATRQPVVNNALLRITSLSAPSSCMQEPDVLAALQAGPTHPRLTEPPLTTSERMLLQRA